MKPAPTSCPDLAPRAEALAIHLLQALTTLHGEGRLVDLDELARTVGARRADVRTTLSRMHREGWIDVLRMRPTMRGFAVGRALAGQRLTPFRAELVDGAPSTADKQTRAA